MIGSRAEYNMLRTTQQVLMAPRLAIKRGANRRALLTIELREVKELCHEQTIRKGCLVRELVAQRCQIYVRLEEPLITFSSDQCASSIHPSS